MCDALEKCTQWISRCMELTNFSESLARSMKQSLAYLQNEFHATAEKLDMRLEEISDLESPIKEIVELPSYLHDHIKSLEPTGRAMLDMAKLSLHLTAILSCSSKELLKIQRVSRL
jgi:hypothetical protein